MTTDELLSNQQRRFGVEIDDLHAELAHVRNIASTEIEKYRETLEIISKEVDCLGPGCPYCDREDRKHPYSATARLAQNVLNNKEDK